LPVAGNALTIGKATSEASVGLTTGRFLGTVEEHYWWLSLADDEVDESRRELGRGYREGLAV